MPSGQDPALFAVLVPPKHLCSMGYGLRLRKTAHGRSKHSSCRDIEGEAYRTPVVHRPCITFFERRGCNRIKCPKPIIVAILTSCFQR